MSIRGLLSFLLIALCGNVYAQISPERTAQARMSKAKWAKAEQSIKKALRKDSINAEARMVYAQWYFAAKNPQFNIDSAYRYTMTSLRNYAMVDQRQRERMSRFPLDSTILIHLRDQIDSAAFERAKQINTESGYIFFLNQFEYARQRDNAIELRDEVSFLDALKINTYQSFDEYLKKYPNSHRALEAKKRYDKLLFEEKTGDGKLKSYEVFYQSFPESPYRPVVAQQIFEISTVSGELKDYLNFISKYKNTTEAKKRAKDIAYHIALQLNQKIPNQILTDSLKNVMAIENGYWVPFLKNGSFGFMNELGKEVMDEQFKSILDEYLCGNINEDYLITSVGVVSRSNKVLVAGKVKAVDDLGFGILMVEMTNGCIKIVHKSGFVLFEDCVVDARIVVDRFLAIKNGKSWTLHSFSGRTIVEEKFEDIQSEGELLVFTRKGKKILNTIDQVTRAADRNPLPDDMVFDEVRKLSTDKILVKNGSLEGVVNSALKFEIPLDRQALMLTSFGFTKRVINKVTTVGLSGAIDKEEYNDIKPYLNWLGLYQPGNIKLYHLPSSKMVEGNLDSLWFTNRLAFAAKGDSVKVIFGSGRKMIFPLRTKVTFVKSPDSVRYFYLEEKNKKQLFDVDSGVKRFSIECDNIESIGNNLFLIETKGKKGLVGLDGKIVLPPEYDAIIKSSDQVISLLKDKKFGLYDPVKKTLFKTIYERNITFFNENVLVAFKDGFYGFMDRSGDPISPFEFDEVKPWSDSVAFVKKNFRWMTYHIFNQSIMQNQIKDYTLIKDSKEEKIAIIHKENEYGVLSSTRGIVIPPTFSDVINLGTAEKPFYFTEKNVEEADLFVVIYYDENGKMIRRQIYEADEYDRIYCKN